MNTIKHETDDMSRLHRLEIDRACGVWDPVREEEFQILIERCCYAARKPRGPKDSDSRNGED